jgi:hypothetical protein
LKKSSLKPPESPGETGEGFLKRIFSKEKESSEEKN